MVGLITQHPTNVALLMIMLFLMTAGSWNRAAIEGAAWKGFGSNRIETRRFLSGLDTLNKRVIRCYIYEGCIVPNLRFSSNRLRSDVVTEEFRALSLLRTRAQL